MSLNLTTNSYEKMNDTNKLLYLILGELREIKQALGDSQTNELNKPKVVVSKNKEKPAKKQVDSNKAKQVQNTCKYCGEVIEGNKGNLMAHYRKCEKRKKEGG